MTDIQCAYHPSGKPSEECPNDVVFLRAACSIHDPVARAEKAEARVAELTEAIGFMTPVIVRSFIQRCPPDAHVDRENAVATLKRLNAAMGISDGLVDALERERATASVGASQPRKAAVALIQREDGRVLCVWNLRYNGFSLPGGMVEHGEPTEAALRRELREETLCEVASSELIFEGEHGLRPKTGERGGRASVVALYRVTATGKPREVEPGCRVEWLTWDEFLGQSPFGAFYRAILPSGPRSSGAQAISPDSSCPRCGAKSGYPCRDERGESISPHGERAYLVAAMGRAQSIPRPDGRSRVEALRDVLELIAKSDHANRWAKAIAQETINADDEGRGR